MYVLELGMKRDHVYVARYTGRLEDNFLVFFGWNGAKSLFWSLYWKHIFHPFEKPKLIFKVKAVLSYSCYWLLQYCSRLYNESVQSLQVIMANLDVCVGKLAKIYCFQYMLSLFWDKYLSMVYLRLYGSWFVNYMLNYPNQDLVVYLMALNYISLISIVKHIKENSNQKIIYTFYGILKNTLQSLGGLENTKSRWQSY